MFKSGTCLDVIHLHTCVGHCALCIASDNYDILMMYPYTSKSKALLLGQKSYYLKNRSCNPISMTHLPLSLKKAKMSKDMFKPE